MRVIPLAPLRGSISPETFTNERPSIITVGMTSEVERFAEGPCLLAPSLMLFVCDTIQMFHKGQARY